MSPATLYREGSDLDELLAELDAQYPQRVRVLDIARPREGGVFGFFAKQRVGVRYRLLDAPQNGSAPSVLARDEALVPRRGNVPTAHDVGSGRPPREAPAAPRGAVGGAKAPSRTTGQVRREAPSADTPSAATETDAGGAQFARILAELARRTGNGRGADPAASEGHTDPVGAAPESDNAADDRDFEHAAFEPAAWVPAGVARAEGSSDAASTLTEPNFGSPSIGHLAAKVQAPSEGTAPPRRSPRAVPRFQPAASDVPVPAAAVIAAPSDTTPAPTQPRPGALNWPISAGTTALATLPRPTTAAPARTMPPRAEQAPHAQHSQRLALRRQLAELGVGIDRIPDGADHVYAAVEQLVRDLPPVPAPPSRPGQILVIAGPARDAVIAAEALSTGTAAGFADVWSYGCPEGIHTRRAAADRRFDSADAAADLAAELRASGGAATVVIVATDAPSWRDSPREVITALAPDATWAVVDATRKPSDSRRALAQIGTLDAVVVANAELSASPATVWDLGLPMALVDGRPAGPSSWAVLLVGRVSEMKELECSAAPY